MRSYITLKSKQRGAIAIITGLMAIVLISFLGVTVDLGHTYIEKSELQNAADAAALAGAKELNQTALGVTAAVTTAITIAGKHKYNFSTPIIITIANIRVGSCPNAGNPNASGRPSPRSPDCTFFPASSITSNAAAAGMTFLEVDTGTRTTNTYFMRVVSSTFATTSTSGYAVAGRFVQDVTPIGVCAVDPLNRTSKYTYADGSTELIELGFRRGVSYNIIQLNPLGGATGTPFLINPVDVPPGSCQPSHSSASFTAPFICQGSSAVASVLTSGSQVYVNTGFSAGPIEKALNSRFASVASDYSGSSCDSSSAPPDTNIKEYKFDPPVGSMGHPRDWMEPGADTLPNHQTVCLDGVSDTGCTAAALGTEHKPYYWPPHEAGPETPPSTNFSEYGALWSFTRAYHASTGSPPAAGSAFDATNEEWRKLYNGDVAGSLLDSTNYPSSTGSGFPAGTPPSPYNQTSGAYFQSPVLPGVRNRRVLNIVIVDCTAFVGSSGLSCQALPVKGIGKFFMQRKADLTGSPKKIETEFAGLIEPVPTADIKLYR
jgi:hypothetical protein